MDSIELDDDLLMVFGVPPNAFAVRPRVDLAVREASDLQQRDDRLRTVPPPNRPPKHYRCVVCTLPGGTCEHTDAWAQAQSRRLLAPSERSGGGDNVFGAVDEVDAQLSDLIDVLGVAAGAEAAKEAAVYSGVADAEYASGDFTDSQGEWNNDGSGNDLTGGLGNGAKVGDGVLESNGGINAHDANSEYIFPDEHQEGNSHHHRSHHHSSHHHRHHHHHAASSSSVGLDPPLERGRQLIAGGQALHAGMDPWEVGAAKGATGAGLLPPPPLRTHRWAFPEQNAHDKVGTTTVDLSTPNGRGGHSLVAAATDTLLSFGGYSCRWETGGERRPFHDFATALLDDPKVLDDGAEYIADLSVYDCVSQEWHIVYPGVVNPTENNGIGGGGGGGVLSDKSALGISGSGVESSQASSSGASNSQYNVAQDDHSESSSNASSSSTSSASNHQTRPMTAAEEVAALQANADAAAEATRKALAIAEAQRIAREAARTVANGGKRPPAGGAPVGRFGHCAVWLGASSTVDSTTHVYGNESEAAGSGGIAPTDGSKNGNPNHNNRNYGSSGHSGGGAGSDYGAQLLPDAPVTSGGDMWMFGGRLRGGKCSNECWLLHWPGSGDGSSTGGGGSPLWEKVGPSEAILRQQEENKADPSTSALLMGLKPAFYCLDARAWPPPRYDAAAVACGAQERYVALSGGRDTLGGNLHGDFWLYARASRHWEQPLLVGVPAAPRYGHSLVLLPGTQGQELLILGGCATSPSQADGRSSDGDEDQDAVDLELSLSAQRVAHAYALEVATAKAAAAALRADALATGHANVVRAWRGAVRDGAAAAQQMQQREMATKREEAHLRGLVNQQDIRLRWAETQADRVLPQPVLPAEALGPREARTRLRQYRRAGHHHHHSTSSPSPTNRHRQQQQHRHHSSSTDRFEADGPFSNEDEEVWVRGDEIDPLGIGHDQALNGSMNHDQEVEEAEEEKDFNGHPSHSQSQSRNSNGSKRTRNRPWGSGHGSGDGGTSSSRRCLGAFGGSRTSVEKALAARAVARSKGLRGGVGTIDGVVVDLATRTFSPLEAQGPWPSARSHACVSVVGGRVLVVGGQLPRDYRAVQAGRPNADLVDGDKQPAVVHVLDTGAAFPLTGRRSMKTGRWKWCQPPSEGSPAWLETAKQASQAAERRAERHARDLKARALAAGVAAGDSQAFRGATARASVSAWRTAAIRKEQASLVHPPSGRAAAAYCVAGQRIFLHGGFTPSLALAELLALDLETADERQRRFHDEFAVRLDREVRQKQQQDHANRRENAFVEALRLAREKHREASERLQMAHEDVLSHMPPLTAPPPVRCVAASADTLWLEWDQCRFDAQGLPMASSGLPPNRGENGGGSSGAYDEDTDNVLPQPHYYLSVRGGFVQPFVGMRVVVAYMPPSTSAKPTAGSRPDDDDDDSFDEHGNSGGAPALATNHPAYAAEMKARAEAEALAAVEAAKPVKGPAGLHDPEAADPWEGKKTFKAKVVRCHGGKGQGTFDLIYGDGGKEFRVPRWRIRPFGSDVPWRLLYSGTETSYEAQGLVPDFALAKEEDTAVRCTFMLQTQFAEYTWVSEGLPPPAGRLERSDELSLPSPEVTYCTRNLTPEERNGTFYSASSSNSGGGQSVSKKKGPVAAVPFKRDVLLENGVTLHVNGPGDIQADGGVNQSIV